MKFTDLFTDDDAVSPVIGVILMVAITVILAAVIGTFVLGLGENTATAPQASFSFDYNSSLDGNLTITHESGDAISSSQLDVVAGIDLNNKSDMVDPTNVGKSVSWEILQGNSNDVKAGTSVTIRPNTTGSSLNNQTVRLVWTDESGSTSATLQKWSGPDA
ncbi:MULTISPECIES: type IV pilin [Haloferax]|uniref:Type IV pilin n=1 Tax=Haloferax marinum TaxID=2666143 RepID=A0A6A8GA26_9EURY|nr:MULTISPECIES: type IV pilin N-terminal domain-containing protein [Haloferax]KAB1198462.1 type IV pilin [Haloferax sp. CBA1150]MRW97565.1 type IV pilin [Haloferax marinum]